MNRWDILYVFNVIPMLNWEATPYTSREGCPLVKQSCKEKKEHEEEALLVEAKGTLHAYTLLHSNHEGKRH